MRYEAMEREKAVRESRQKGAVCPFVEDASGASICRALDFRCGEREQFSEPMQPETEEMKSRSHRCMRTQYFERKIPRVMIADDDESIRDLCSQFLKAKGEHHFIFAPDGEIAKRLLDSLKRECEMVHVIVSDVEMGSEAKSGYQLAEFVHSRNFPCRMVMMTAGVGGASTNSKVVLKVLSKPFRYEEISKAMDQALNQS